MKRLEGSRRWLDGSVVDVCRVDFWFPVNILVDFICYCMGLVLGLIKSLLSGFKLCNFILLVSLMIY